IRYGEEREGSMLLSDEQTALRDAARRYARSELLPTYQRRESEARLDPALLRTLGEMGFIGMSVAPLHGGLGADAVTTGLVLEELSYGDFNIGSYVVTQTLCAAIIERNAEGAVAAEWLPRICAGRAIVALAVTEPHAGSDAAAIRVSARRDGDDY